MTAAQRIDQAAELPGHVEGSVSATATLTAALEKPDPRSMAT